MKAIKVFFIQLFFFFVTPICIGQQQKESKINYPIFKQHTQSHNLFGRVVVDEYANIEKLDDQTTRNWLKTQDSIAENYFSSSHLVEEYIETYKNLEAKNNGSVSMVRMSETGKYFYLKYDEITGIEKLFFRQQIGAPESEIFDPSSYGSIAYLKPSWAGEYIAVGIDAGNGFSSNVYIIDVTTGEMLRDVITNVNPDFGGIEWLPDGSGFIYLYFPVVEHREVGYKRNSYSVLHKLGENPQKLTVIFSNSNEINVHPHFFPKVKIGTGASTYVVGYIANSDDFYDAYITKLSDLYQGKPQWQPFFKKDHKIYYNQGEIRGNDFIFRQASTEGNRIAKTSVKTPNFDDPQVLAEGEKESPITSFAVTKDKVYYTRTKFGVEVELFELDSLYRSNQVRLPFSPGSLSFFGESSRNNQIVVGIDGWTSNYTRYIIHDDSITKETLIKVSENSEFDNLISKQIMVTSHDGELVPLSIVHTKGLLMDSNNEVFIYVYGAYGESMSPFFSPIFLDWATRGGILAFPHVRGGGEKGKEWHIAGMKNLKYNSWKDLNACVETLIDLGYTRKGLIALYTSSAGGITGGMAVNERPDLYSSFIALVPRLNPFGLESSSTITSSSYLEYGSVEDSTEVDGLIKMDPYLNLKKGMNYPATLIMPSYKDDRIPLWDSGKYIAKLQKVNSADSPILLDIDYESGHNSNGESNDAIILYSKIFSFAKANLH